jgi:hypothetical protein
MLDELLEQSGIIMYILEGWGYRSLDYKISESCVELWSQVTV